MKKTPQGMWKIVKSVSRKRNPRTWDSLLSDASPEMLANTIVDDLNIRYSSLTHPEEFSVEDDNWAITIEEDLIFGLLKRLDKTKAAGIDNVPTQIYSEMADCLVKPLKLIFDFSIKQRVLPSLWKTSIICPIPKTTLARQRPTKFVQSACCQPYPKCLRR